MFNVRKKIKENKGDKGKPELETKQPPWQLAFSGDCYLEVYPCFFFFSFWGWRKKVVKVRF